MSRITEPRIGQTSTTGGTGPFALTGGLIDHNAFSVVCSVGDTFWGDISGVDPVTLAPTADWVEGLCTYSAANEVTMTTVYRSSNGNNAVTFPAGMQLVRIIADARQIAKLDDLPQDLSGLVPKTTTVNGHALTGNVTVTKGDVSLGNVDNTSDANKPVSTAQAAADAAVLATAENYADILASGLVPKTTTVNGQALTGNVSLTTANISDSANRRYVTDAQLAVVANTSNVNTGDQNLAPYALLAGTLAQFANTSSAQLAGIMTDETGSGPLVFANSPTLVTPNLGTPSGIVLTNATGTAAGLTAGNATLAAALATTVFIAGVAFNGTANVSVSASNISTGTLAAARGGAGTVSGIMKADGNGVVSAAVVGTDYAGATSGNSILYGNGAGGFSNVTIGNNLTFNTANGRLDATGGGGSGSITASGYTMNTSRLLGRTTANSGAVEEISVTGATFANGTLSITGGSSPSVITASPSADQNDYAPTGWASTTTTLALTPTTSVVITGLSASGFTGGQPVKLRNDSTDKLVVLADENAASSAANRLTLSNSNHRGHVIIFPGDSLTLEYDGTASRWKADAYTPVFRQTWLTRQMRAQDSSTAIHLVGFSGTTTEASVISTSLASGSYLGECVRTTCQTTTSVGASAGFRHGNNDLAMRGDAAGRGGFAARIRFGGGANPANAGACFVGIRTNATAVGNNDASALTNIIGVGTDASQSTFRRLHNDGSGTATAADLGANFAWDSTSVYELNIYAPPNASGVAACIWRCDDLTVAPVAWYDSSDLPSTTTALAFTIHVGNRAAGAAYGLTFMSYEAWTPN